MAGVEQRRVVICPKCSIVYFPTMVGEVAKETALQEGDVAHVVRCQFIWKLPSGFRLVGCRKDYEEELVTPRTVRLS